MSDWKVIGRHRPASSELTGAIPGFPESIWYVYTIENTETGEEKEVTAEDRYELGELIAEGDFDDEDDDE